MNLVYLVCTRPATNRLITYHLHPPRSLFDEQCRSLLDHLPVLHILTASTIYITCEYAKINQPGFGRSTFIAFNTAWISCGPSLNVGFLISGTSGGLLVVLTEVWLLTAFGFNHYVIDPQWCHTALRQPVVTFRSNIRVNRYSKMHSKTLLNEQPVWSIMISIALEQTEKLSLDQTHSTVKFPLSGTSGYLGLSCPRTQTPTPAPRGHA